MKPKYALITVALASSGWLLFERWNSKAPETSSLVQQAPASTETVQTSVESAADDSPQPAVKRPIPAIVSDAAPSNVASSSPRSAAPSAQRFPAQIASALPTPATGTKPSLVDPDARVALSFVGFDPQAESYWADAINDPSLPAHERQDLIEDLNEDGFMDPDRPTRDELPLIYSRLAIIAALAPDAMDQVNADAFQEAAKDLVNMAARASE